MLKKLTVACLLALALPGLMAAGFAQTDSADAAMYQQELQKLQQELEAQEAELERQVAAQRTNFLGIAAGIALILVVLVLLVVRSIRNKNTNPDDWLDQNEVNSTK